MSNTTNMALSENLQFLRARQGVTQEQLAEKLDVSRQSVSKWESGASFPEMETLLKLCDMFHTDMDTLLRGNVEQSCAEDGAGYDRFMTRFALKIAGSVSAIIAGASLVCLLEAAGCPDHMAAGAFLLVVTAAVVVIITSSIQHGNFSARNPQIADFYSQSQRDAFNQRFVWYIAAPVGAILAACALMLLAKGNVPDQMDGFLVAGFLAVVAVSVFFLVCGGILKAKYDVEAYNYEHGPAPEGKIVGAIDGIIMLIATGVFLVLAVTKTWLTVCWLPFPIGGMLCGAVGVWAKAKREAKRK